MKLTPNMSATSSSNCLNIKINPQWPAFYSTLRVAEAEGKSTKKTVLYFLLCRNSIKLFNHVT